MSAEIVQHDRGLERHDPQDEKPPEMGVAATSAACCSISAPLLSRQER